MNKLIPLSDDPIPLYLSVVLGRGSSVIGTPMHLYLLDILIVLDTVARRFKLFFLIDYIYIADEIFRN